MSRKSFSIIAAALILTLFGVNVASAQGWDSDLSDGTIFVESNYSVEDQDPANGIYFKPVTYFMIEGDELFVVHSGHSQSWLPAGPLPAFDEVFYVYAENAGQTFREYLENEGFEWDAYDLEYVQQIVFMGSEVGDSVRNATDIPSMMYGGDSMDYMLGGSASDTIYGYGGNDRLVGNEGNDVLIGGAGIDELWGDDGADYLDFGFDTIEKGNLYLSSGRIDTIVVNYEKSSVNRKWYSKFPTFQSYGTGAKQYSDSYLNQHAIVKKRYVSKYRVTFYNPDMARRSSNTDTSQIDLRR